jgi:SpoVK/Ycf46/Vps4 family AAA+-type ATPase
VRLPARHILLHQLRLPHSHVDVTSAIKPVSATGAELRHLCNEAAIRAVHRQRENGSKLELAQADFEAALSCMSPALTGEDLERYQDWAARFSR